MPADVEDSNSITRFRIPWVIDEINEDQELIVLALRQDPSLWSLVPESGVAGYLHKKREQPSTYFLFRSAELFQMYAAEASSRCANTILEEAVEVDEINTLLKCALTLQPANPTLLALRVHFLVDNPSVRRSAERLLQMSTEQARLQFRQQIAALEQTSQAPEKCMLLKYENRGGLGGFNLDDAVDQLNAFHLLQESFEPEVRRKLPFLRESERLPLHRVS
jgi:hypothetical protein